MNPVLWTPTPEWEGQDAFLIGGGPSLAHFDFALLKGRNVIGCNDAFFLGPEIVSICCFGDVSWWQKQKQKLAKFPNRLVTNAPSVLPYNLPNLLKTRRVYNGLHKGSTLGWNYSTGALAINLAINLGAKRIFLLGYDLANIGKDHHWHQHNQKPVREPSFQRFIGGFKRLAQDVPANVQILNVSNGTTRLQVWPVITFAAFHASLGEPKLQAA